MRRWVTASSRTSFRCSLSPGPIDVTPGSGSSPYWLFFWFLGLVWGWLPLQTLHHPSHSSPVGKNKNFVLRYTNQSHDYSWASCYWPGNCRAQPSTLDHPWLHSTLAGAPAGWGREGWHEGWTDTGHQKTTDDYHIFRLLEERTKISRDFK